MTRKTVKLLFALVAGFVLLVPIARAQVTDTNIKIRQYTLALSPGQPGQDPNQAGGNPNVEIFMRFCQPGLLITNVSHAVPADPSSAFRVTTAEPHGILSPGTVVRVVKTGVAGADGLWNASRVDDNTFQLDTKTGVATGDMKFSPGPRAQVSPNFGCVGSGLKNEIQLVSPKNATGGSFTLTFRGQTTSAIPFNADNNAEAAAIQSALQALSTIGAGNVTVEVAQGFGFKVTFTNALGNQDVDQMTATSSLTPSPAATVTVTTSAEGSAFEELGSKIKDFKIHLPPGFLGNPTANSPCPEALWIAESCPDSALLGRAMTLVRADGLNAGGQPTFVPTNLYNVQTFGLAPARLGTNKLSSTPPGPFPVAISLRTSTDYGIDSAFIDVPKNLGGPQAQAVQIYTVLCARVPCKATDQQDPASVVPLTPNRPFFRNPTSCGVNTGSLDAVSWSATPVTDHADASPTFTTDHCENVPFDAGLTVDPQETHEAGKASAQKVTIDYGGNYADDPIWQAALRKADVTLPKGMTLSPGGGVGLRACSFDEFGVSSVGPKHQQLDNDPPSCPDGSQIGTINVETPVLPNGSLTGKVFFGPVTGPFRPTPASPWKLFLMIEGAGLRIKLVGDVDVCGPMDQPHPDYCTAEGQIHNVFVEQPQVPFNKLELNLNGGDRSVLANPNDCTNPHNGDVELTGWNDKIQPSTPQPHVDTTNCPDPIPFAPVVESAGSNPEQAGANTTSHIVLTREDGQDDIKNIKLSLPSGAVGSLAAVPQCSLADARTGNCPIGTKIGTVNTTVGTGSSLLTTSGSLFLAEPSQPGDAATLALTVPAKVGPIDLGQVVVLNRVILRPSDTGVDTVTSDVPNIIEGVPLHVRRIEITVDRPGFFINPTGCDPRPLDVTFTGYTGAQSNSVTMLSAKGCENLPFGPKLRLIAGARGQNAQFTHPPLTAIVTQGPGEANIKNSEVILPDLLRPNAVQFNVPGGLCSDAEFARRACPGPSLVGSARVITPVLPFQLSGPVYVVQEIGSVLPKLYVVLRGNGIEVVLRARNSFLHAIQTVNTFDGLPDVPQSYFELKIKGGPGGILNNFYDACGVAKAHRKFDYTFTGQNGKQAKKSAYLAQEGCVSASSLRASIASRTIKVNRKGVGKLKVRCSGAKACKVKVNVSAKGVKAAKSVSIGAKKAKSVALKFSKGEVKKLRKKHRLKGKATAKVGGKSAKRSVTLVYKG